MLNKGLDIIMSVFSLLLPESDDPEKVRAWRYKVAWCLTLSILGGTIGAPFLAELRYTTKAEAQEIHAELQGVKEEVKGVKDALDSFTSAYKKSEEERTRRELEVAVRDLRDKIFQTQKEACLQSGRLREVLQGTVEALKSDFMALTGEEYPQILCSAFREE